MNEQNTARDATSVCVPNIGPGERRKRLVFGAVAAVVSVAILAALLASDANRWWRVLLLLPFWACALGFIQVREKT